jgi:hypothetical protein
MQSLPTWATWAICLAATAGLAGCMDAASYKVRDANGMPVPTWALRDRGITVASLDCTDFWRQRVVPYGPDTLRAPIVLPDPRRPGVVVVDPDTRLRLLVTYCPRVPLLQRTYPNPIIVAVNPPRNPTNEFRTHAPQTYANPSTPPAPSLPPAVASTHAGPITSFAR